MKKLSVLLVIFILPCYFLFSSCDKKSERTTYEITCELDGNILKGKEKVEFYNSTENAFSSLKFNLFSNAFRKDKDIIKKLDKGEDFDKLAKENSDDEGSKEKGGDLGYFNKGDMVEEFENAAYDLKVSEYTKEPVKTTYGYHIILKTGEKEKASYKSLKNDIKEKIKDKKLEEDKTLTVTALDEIRKNYKLKIKDSKLKKLYKEYIEEQIETSKEKTNE